MTLKEFKKENNEAGGICPECGKFNGVNEGSSIAGSDGSFFSCAYCGKPSVLIYNGAQFTGRGTVYKIEECTGAYENMILCYEVSRMNPELNPANNNICQYFSRNGIIGFMSEKYSDEW